MSTARIGYAELHCLSHFSFGRGASSARELFERARRNGYAALAITDECTLAGIVRALEASRETGVKLIVGTEVVLQDGLKLVLLAEDRDGYTALCKLITQGRRRAEKASTHCTARISPMACRARWRCGFPAPRPMPRRASGCVRGSPIGCGSPWSCTAAPTTTRGWRRCSRWEQGWICRWPPPATSTCMRATAASCRTR